MSTLGEIARRTGGTATIARQLVGQRRAPYLAPDEQRRRRDRGVRAIVRHAAAHVPFYREWFATSRVRPDEIATAADLVHLPIVEKDMIARDPRRFVAETREGRSGFAMQTSGSTGAPLTVVQSRRYLLANAAVGERDAAPLREVLGPGTAPRIANVYFPGNSGHKIRAQARRWAFVPNWVDRESVSLFEPIEAVVAGINRRKPNVIMAYGSFLDVLFGAVQARGLDMHRPRAVVYASDHLSARGRQIIEHELGIAVLSLYNAVEAFKIGFTCRAGSGFHLNSDLAHVRVVDPRGIDVAPGMSGEILVSNLANRGTVLLNYRIGDTGALAADAGCACGRTLPVLARLEGRSDDVIELRDGRHVHSAEIWSLVSSSPGLIQYQLVQHTVDRFEVKIVAPDRVAYERLAADLCLRLQGLLGDSASVTASPVDPLAPFGMEKRRQVVSHVARRPTLQGAGALERAHL